MKAFASARSRKGITATASAATWRASFSKIDRAIADYSEAIRLPATKRAGADPLLYIWRANLYLAHARDDLALADLERGRSDSTLATAWLLYHRGLAYARKRMFDQAIADFEEGRKLSQGDKHGTADVHAIPSGLSGHGRPDRGGLSRLCRDRRARPEPSRHPALATRAWFIDRPNGDYDAALKKLDETPKGG